MEKISIKGNINVSENTTAVTTISDLDNTANSFALSGADAGSFNISNAGVPVNIAYGEILVGSIVVSNGVDTVQVEGTN